MNPEKWPVKELIYTTVMGVLMIAALLEWFLWLGMFVYCLAKCYSKAARLSTKVLAVIMIILFTLTRFLTHLPQHDEYFSAIFLPIMLVTLPLPTQISQHFPREMVSSLQWFAFWTFCCLLTIPWLFCIFNLVTNNIGRHQRIRGGLDELYAPKVVVIMPCYNEEPQVLLQAIDSVVGGDYPPACLHLFVSFDGEEEKELYTSTLRSLGVQCLDQGNPASLDISYRGSRITISRFKHGGKRKVQKRTFQLVDKIYKSYLNGNDDLFVLFIDSDCFLDKFCIQNFMWEMELKHSPKKSHMLAMTGVITSTTRRHTLVTLLQDTEYIHGQLFERSVESSCGAVTCLPGALTILRFSAFRRIARFYFDDPAEHCLDSFDYGKIHLGEDRYLTHLFMIGAQKSYQIGMSAGAFCKTPAVSRYRDLIKQRRRWFIGFITNEACMLTDIRLWKKYPLLCIVRFMQNTIRTTALLFVIMVLALVTTTDTVQHLPVGFIAIALCLNWTLMVYYGFKLKRYKAWLYPVMFIMNPFLNWVYLFYRVLTFTDRTWGGPRANLGKSKLPDARASVAANHQASDMVMDTSRSTPSSPLPPPLQPSDSIEGCFAVPEPDENDLYAFSNTSTLNFSCFETPTSTLSQHPKRPTGTMISSTESSLNEYTPQVVSPPPSRANPSYLYMHDHKSSSFGNSTDGNDLNEDGVVYEDNIPPTATSQFQ